MDFSSRFYADIPSDPNEEAENILANVGMARTLWGFFSACKAQGFRDEYAYGLTLTFFEGLWNNTVEEDDDGIGRMEDDCK